MRVMDPFVLLVVASCSVQDDAPAPPLVSEGESESAEGEGEPVGSEGEEEQDYVGLYSVARVTFHGSALVSVAEPCVVDGPYNIDVSDNIVFAPVYPGEVTVDWTAGDLVYDGSNVLGVQYYSSERLPTEETTGFFWLGRFDVQIGDPDLLAQRPFSITCDGEPVESGYYLYAGAVVSDEENEAEGVTREEVEQYVTDALGPTRAANEGAQFINPQGYEAFRFQR